MKDSLDQTLQDEQASFRKERYCTDQIAILIVIVEQTIKCQTPLYIWLVDFEKVLDITDRQTIWNIRLHYGVPIKMVNIIFKKPLWIIFLSNHL